MGRPSKGIRLKQRSNGFYYIVWPGNHKGQSTGTRDGEVAHQALAAFIIERGKLDPDSGDVRLSVTDAVEIYMVEHIRPREKLAGRVVTDGGVETAEFKADFLKTFFVDKAVADIVPDDIIHPETGYIAMRCAGKVRRTHEAPVRTCQPYTIRRDLGLLISALKWCSTVKDAQTGRIRLPAKDVPTIPLPPPAPKRERWLTLEEETKLLMAAPATEEIDPETGKRKRLSRIHRFLVLAVEDGARCEAIEELTWFQVDFKAGTVDYRKPGVAAQHNKRRAKVKMTARSRAMLERAFKERTGPFVLDHKGAIRKSFETAVDRAQLDGVSPHILRHTWATRAIQNGVPPQEVADQLADDIRTIMKNYYHHSPEYMRKASSWRDQEAAGEAAKKEQAS